MNVPDPLVGHVRQLINQWWTQQAAFAENPEANAAIALSNMSPVRAVEVMPEAESVEIDATNDDDSDDETVISNRKRQATRSIGAKDLERSKRRRCRRSFVDADDEAKYRMNPKNKHHLQLHVFLIAAKEEFKQEAMPSRVWRKLAAKMNYKFVASVLTHSSAKKESNVGQFFPYLLATKETYQLHPNFFRNQ